VSATMLPEERMTRTVEKLDPEQVRLWKDPSQLQYHTQQFAAPYRSTVHLLRFIATLPLTGGEALDVACGAGANIAHLSGLSPSFRWTGIDLAGELLFPAGRRELAARGIEAKLVDGNLYELTHIFPRRSFDLVLMTQTLSWLPDYEGALDQLFAMTRGWLIVSALITDFDVDVKCEAQDLTIPDLPPYCLRILSLKRFREACEHRGAREVIARDFAIDIDLPRPASNGLGTYTETLAEGRRLQLTGPVLQPWKFVAVRI
jgi:SAM-dependent methyltransferase